jgi:NAD(P)-dependent dehydrogenase (short-subunit alcohol dehydrogenase family)
MSAPTTPLRRFEGVVAVVTGGGGGIGLATAERLLAEGARVAVWDVRLSDAIASVRDRAGDRLLTDIVDVCDAGAVQAAASRLVEAAGGIDVLVNNAGLTDGYREAMQITDASWHRVMDTNVAGALHCAQACVPAMQARGRGRIVNLSSVFADHGFPGQSAYAASKSAIVALTRVWAREFAPLGITVNAVSPGYIRTPMNAGHPEPFTNLVVGRTPLRRVGEAAEVAAAIAFLASDDAAFITGTVLPVDGGLTA